MNVKTNILGIDYHFGLGFLNELLDGTGMKLNELGDQDDAILMPKLIYYSRVYADKRKNINPDYTLYDIHDYVDEQGGINSEFWITFKIAFNDAMNKDVPVEDKKKVTQKKK